MKTNLSAPWINMYHKIVALFGKDPDIKIVYDEENVVIKLYVEKQDKAAALKELLPDEYDFGNVILRVDIIPANPANTRADLFHAAFENNPVFSYMAAAPDIFSNPINYIVFKNEVVQYFNDDISDVNGNCSTLYQEIAKDVFGEEEGVYFCTDLPESVSENG